MSIINSKDPYKMFKLQINEIRNILRTCGITDMDSVNHCLAFLTVRMLTEDVCSKFDIDPKFAFDNFRVDVSGEELDEQELKDKFFDGSKDCFVGVLKFNYGFKSFSYLNKISNQQISKIFDILEKIDTDELKKSYDLVGIIYEIHLSSGSGSARDLGQYFTNRKVIEYMIELANPQLKKNGEIESIVDPTMGTGGFLIKAVDFLNQKYKNSIDWSRNSKNVYGFDLSERVRDMAELNCQLSVGERFSNLLTRDTLYNDMKIASVDVSADVILANEPMGLKNIKYELCAERIRKLKISKGTKSEPLFLQLMMAALKKNGRCVVVVPDGVLFQSSKLHRDTRKYLLEKFEVMRIIKLADKNFWLNTGISASIIFFKNSGQSTKEIIFEEISLNKNQTKIQKKLIQTVTIEAIVGKDYTLNPVAFQVAPIIVMAGADRLMSLGDCCDFLPKSKRLASFADDTGQYEFYTSSFVVKKCQVADFQGNYLIIGTGGNANVHMAKEFSCSNHVQVCKQKSPEISLEYVYFYLLNNLDILSREFTGTGLKNLSIVALKNIQIKVPNIEDQLALVKKLSEIVNFNENSRKMVNSLDNLSKIAVETLVKNPVEEVLLGDLLEIKNGKKCPEESEDSKAVYPCYGGGREIRKVSNFNREGENLIVSRVGLSENNCCRIVTGKFWLTDNGFTLHLKNPKMSVQALNFICQYLLPEKMLKLCGGTCQKVISKTALATIKLPIISPSQQELLINRCLANNQLKNSLLEQIEQQSLLGKIILQ